jgi:hypothetical protein
VADDEADCHCGDWQHTKIIELAAHVNNLVDIVNGRGEKTDDAAAVAPALATSVAPVAPVSTTAPVDAAPVDATPVASAAPAGTDPVDAAPVAGDNSGDADGHLDNCQHTSHFVPENATPIQEKLLEVLEWFCLWRASAVQKGKEKEKEQFLSDPTWKGIKRMILGCVGMLGCCVKRQQHVIVPRKTLSDPCEHHFANSRANVGSTNNPNVMQQNAVTNRCEMCTHARHESRQSKGNSSHAPFEPHARNSQCQQSMGCQTHIASKCISVVLCSSTAKKETTKRADLCELDSSP